MLVDYSMTGISTSTTTVTFQPGVIANGTVSNVNYIFSIPEKVTGTAIDGTAVGTIEMFQGQYLKSTFVINDSQPNQRFIIPNNCLLYTSPSPRDRTRSRMPSSA